MNRPSSHVTFAAKHWPTPCLSTLGAEYIALTYAAKELLFIASIFTELKFAVLATPIPMLSDSAGAISFAEQRASATQTPSNDLRHFFLRHYIRSGLIRVDKIDTDSNVRCRCIHETTFG